MKSASSLDYVTIAASKDKTRPSLNGVYRDTAEFVATDGCRLHWSNGLPVIEKGSYLDGRTSEFPAWRQVLPTGTAKAAREIVLSQENLKALKAMLPFVKHIDPSWLAVNLNFQADKLEISLADCSNSNASKMSHEITIGENTSTFSVRLNLSYFIDAIEMPIKNGAHGLAGFGVQFFSDTQPLLLDSNMGHAVIMPLKK